MLRLLRRLDEYLDPDPAFQSVYGLTLEEAEREWRAELAGGPITRLVGGDAALAFERGSVVLEERSRSPIV